MFGGLHVFPGGKVDDADHARQWSALARGPDDASASASLGVPSGGLSYWVACIRECFEEAGEMTSAGDLYRVLEQYEKAGICFEKQGEYAQAAEMFGAAGDRIRAGENYERAGQHREAAECYALSGKHDREAELLAKAGDFLRAGEMYRTDKRDDDAIKALQQVDQTHEDFAKASALLGEIFRQRGMLSLAIAKLMLACRTSSSPARCASSTKRRGAPSAISSRAFFAKDAMDACSAKPARVQYSATTSRVPASRSSHPDQYESAHQSPRATAGAVRGAPST